MKKHVLVIITIGLYVLNIVQCTQIDYASWITLIIFDGIFELYLYAQKPAVKNEDTVSFHSRNLLGNTVWRTMLQPSKHLCIQTILTTILHITSVAFHAKTIKYALNDPLTYAALQVFAHWIKAPEGSWWVPISVTFFLFSAETFLLYRTANVWMITDSILQMIPSLNIDRKIRFATYILCTPLLLTEIPTWNTLAMIPYLCAKNITKHMHIHYIFENFRIPIVCFVLSAIHWDIRIFACGCMGIVAFAQKRIIGHKWEQWTRYIFWAMVIIQTAIVDWIHIFVSQFY